MIVYPCLCTGADSTYGIDSSLGIDSSPGIDSTLESIPCDSDSGSFSIIPVTIPVPEKNGIITPLVGTMPRIYVLTLYGNKPAAMKCRLQTYCNVRSE